jgi:Uma2 family endonuclease
MAAKTVPRSTFADVLALESKTGKTYELVDGQIIERAGTNFEHGDAQTSVALWAKSHFGRRGGLPDHPTGWYIASEVDLRLDASTVVAPDLCGWRRARVTREHLMPRPVEALPEWVCEILSPSNRRNDLVVKQGKYRIARVPHYWTLDPSVRSLTVYRWSEGGYILALAGEAEDTVRAEPFEEVEVRVRDLFTSDEEGK